MVQKEDLEKLFSYEDGSIYGKFCESRRKASNTRVVGKDLGTIVEGGYKQLVFTVNGVKCKELVHRVIWALHHNEWPELLDHIDRDPTNNRIGNLRVANKKINSINSGLFSNNTSGIKGVSWNKNSQKWTAQIKDNQKKIHLGSFSSFDEAIIARLKAEERLWGDIR